MVSIDDIYPSDFLTASDITNLGGTKVAVVKMADVQTVGRDQNSEDKIVLGFVELQKRMVLNKTNANKLAEITGTKDYTAWAGTAVELYTVLTTFSGREVEAIRIRAPVKR